MTELPPPAHPPRGPIGLADALRAVATLAADAAGRRAVLAALGFDAAPEPPVERAPVTPPVEPRAPPPPPPPPPAEEVDELRLPPGWENEPATDPGPAAAPATRVGAEAWAGDLLTAPAYAGVVALARSAGPTWAHTPEPLVPTACARAVFADLLAVPLPSAGPDVAAMIERLSRCRPVVPIHPRRWSVRLGAGVVLDRSRSMMPYWADLDDLAGRLRGLIPADRLGLRWVAGPADLDAAPGPPAAPLLLVTDFGAADPWSDPAAPGAWADLARRAAADGRRVVVLTPGPTEWVPAGVRRYARVRVEWDAAAARTAARRR